MPDEKRKLTPDELWERWNDTPGIEFREEIIKQLQNEETGCRVDWENLKVAVEREEYKWIDFPGVREVKENPVKYKEIIFPEKKRPIVKSNSLYGDLRGIDLFKEKLPKSLLACIQCNGADLSLAHLEGANLRYSNFEGADLSLAHLEGANLRYSNFEGADLSLAHLEGANLYSAHLEGANLTNAQFHLKSFWWRIGFSKILL